MTGDAGDAGVMEGGIGDEGSLGDGVDFAKLIDRYICQVRMEDEGGAALGPDATGDAGVGGSTFSSQLLWGVDFLKLINKYICQVKMEDEGGVAHGPDATGDAGVGELTF